MAGGTSAWTARLRAAKLRQQASVEDVDYRAARGLDRALFRACASEGDLTDAHDNLALVGPSGVGKSWLACAIGQFAATAPSSIIAAEAVRGPGRCPGRWATSAPYQISRPSRPSHPRRSWPRAPDAGARHDLLEILEERYGRRSTIVTTAPAVRLARGHRRPHLCRYILDRLHNAHRIELTGESLRRARGNNPKRLDLRPRNWKKLSANKLVSPGGIISLQGAASSRNPLGAIIPLQTGGFTGIGKSSVASNIKSSYWLCVGLLGACLLCELVFLAQLPIPLRSIALSSWWPLSLRSLSVSLLVSNIARYVGAVILGASALYTISVIFGAKIVVNFPLLAAIALATGLELIAACFLALSGTFSREFNRKRENAPPVVGVARLSILILLAACVIVLTAHDIYRLVHA